MKTKRGRVTKQKETQTYFFFIADRFDKHAFGAEARRFQDAENVLTSFAGGIGRVKGRDADSVLPHVLEEIGQCRIARHAPGRIAFHVVRIVPVGRHLRPAQLPAVIPHVEDLRRDVVKKR